MFVYVRELKHQAELTQRSRCNMPCRVEVSKCIALLILNLTARWEWMVNDTPQPLYPWGRAPVLRRVGMPQGPSARVRRRENLFPPLGFKPRTVQCVASCYTDYVIPAQFDTKYIFNLMFAIYSYTPVQVRLTRSNGYNWGLFL